MLQLERDVHKFLSRWPRLKNFTKIAYQLLWTMASNRKNFISSIVVKKFTNAFVGFHDVKCYCSSSKRAVFHSVNDNRRHLIKSTDTVDICVYNFDTDSAKIIASTKAFNWQMGSRLQILGSGEIIWNTVEDSYLKSKTFKESKFNTSPFSVYSVSSKGIVATVNFSNIERNMAGYGYVGSFIEFCAKDEILLWDLKSGAIVLKIKIACLGHDEFISHLQFNAEGNMLAFFIRKKNPYYTFSTVLVVYDVLTGEEIARSSNVSVITHFTWRDHSLLMFCLLGGRFQYINYDFLVNDYAVDTVLRNLPDGHPCYVQGIGMVTDTYPDKRRRQRLYFINGDCNAPALVGEFYSPLFYQGYSRVDLHPRLHEDGVISVDFVDEGAICTCLIIYN